MVTRQSPAVLAREILSEVKQKGNNRYLNDLQTTSVLLVVVLFVEIKKIKRNTFLLVILLYPHEIPCILLYCFRLLHRGILFRSTERSIFFFFGILWVTPCGMNLFFESFTQLQ